MQLVSLSLCICTRLTLIIYDCFVGKTCLQFRFVRNECMSSSYISIVGVDMKVIDSITGEARGCSA